MAKALANTQALGEELENCLESKFAEDTFGGAGGGGLKCVNSPNKRMCNIAPLATFFQRGYNECFNVLGKWNTGISPFTQFDLHVFEIMHLIQESQPTHANV